MPSSLSRLASLLLVLAVTLPQLADAQSVTVPATTTPGLTPSGTLNYQGPRYPGGPDSLRAFVARQLRAANPAWVGDVFLRLTLDTLGNAQKADFLVPPPGTPAATLVRNADVQALVTRVVRYLPRWQPGPKPAGVTGYQPEPVVLRLPFGTTGLQPLPYSDDAPVFALPKAVPGRARYPVTTLRHLLQLLVRYPAADMRANRQGEVWTYFEVSETGAVEQRRVIGSLSPTLDQEVTRALLALPNALVPPRQQGRPVRVAYVVPLKFVITTVQVGK